VDLTLISLWFHIPLVTAWIGLVMFDLFAGAAPGLTLAQRARLLGWSRPFVLVAIVLILLTGIRQTMDNPFLHVDSWSTLEKLRDKPYGLALFWKHGCVLATFTPTIVVRFVLAPRLAEEARGEPATIAPGGVAAAVMSPTRRLIVGLSALNLVTCAGALILATVMVWQLH
jgi:hypothetical protein